MASEKVKQRVSEARKNAVDLIVKMMQEGGLNWVCQWEEGAFMPRNGATNHRYRGGNRFHLMAMAYLKGYEDNRWFTFKQAKEAGFTPRKGEKASIVEYWKRVKGMKDAEGNWTNDPALAEQTIIYPALMGYFSVFNAEQLADRDGNSMPADELASVCAPDPDLSAVADRLKETSRCAVRESAQVGQACYIPFGDRIEIPAREGFRSMEGFITVLAHEMTHSTMKPLDRVEGAAGRFGSKPYAFEELVAELGSTFACIELGVHRTADLEGDSNFHNHAAYLQSWLESFGSDPDYLFRAASKADEAADYILGRYRGESKAA